MKMASKSEYKLSESIMDVIGFLIISLIHVIQAIWKYFLPNSMQPIKSIEGEIALVTGGGGGLGRLLAMRLSKLGATVVLWDINISSVDETVDLVKGIGGQAFGFKCDIADKDDVYRVAKLTRKSVGEVTILINNAGVSSGHLLLNTPDHLIKRTFDVNIIAHFWTVKAFLPKMIEANHGHIVTVASMAGYVGIFKMIDYCSSKFAAVGFDEALRVELEALGIDGVKTTCINPYFIEATGMFGKVNSRYVPTLKPNDVADRVIEGILREETTVMLPRIFYIGMALKAIMPWSIASMFLRGIVPDPHPDSVFVKPHLGADDKITDTIKVNSISQTVASLNQRVTISGKNL